ncbi:hypothetical protein [Effusibacillus dendaii]|uniref:Uncharacterized protein n=1 Tax=Effusibacillus dendaii TaxID=2743772 RepID=A0A7I8DCC7_9BACL|nr:hypothetical protein [Effusibacillus dendaii]BCJ86486.1 hypothetical protein skT53_14710 [Effusibacillus dendaii]
MSKICKHDILRRSCYTCDLEDEVKELREENELYRKALEKVNYYNSDTVTNDRRIRHIIGQIVDEALKVDSKNAK